ncbi:hypothetical protein ACFLXE_05435 [Chloroflexota bacterium]
MDLSMMTDRVEQSLDDLNNEVWQPAEIERAIDRAVVDLSKVVPDEKTQSVTAAREMSTTSLTGLIKVVALEYPEAQTYKRFRDFAFWNDKVELLIPDVTITGNATIYYEAVHVLDAQGSTIPPELEDLVELGAVGYALLEKASGTTDEVTDGDTTRYKDLGNDALKRFQGLLEIERAKREADI